MQILNAFSTGYNASRIHLFKDYEQMDRDSILNSALDLYAAESAVKNEYNDVLTINSQDQQIKQILQNLFYDILNIQFNLTS